MPQTTICLGTTNTCLHEFTYIMMCFKHRMVININSESTVLLMGSSEDGIKSDKGVKWTLIRNRVLVPEWHEHYDVKGKMQKQMLLAQTLPLSM